MSEWKEWGWLSSEWEEHIRKTKMEKEKALKLARPILWQDKTGKYVVIEGPFPYGFVRSADAKSVHMAARRDLHTDLGEIMSRPETNSDKRYAKTLADYVLPVENEWGPVSY